MNTTQRRHRQSGQAMAEMVVSMVALMVVLVGLLYIARLGVAHTEAMHEARSIAGEHAMQQAPPLADPSFIRDWNVGPDGARYSRDDTMTEGSPSEFRTRIGNTAETSQLESFLPGNPVSEVAAHPSPQHLFGMVRGDAFRYVDTPPAVRNLIYNADTIDLRAEVWMIHTKGIR